MPLPGIFCHIILLYINSKLSHNLYLTSPLLFLFQFQNHRQLWPCLRVLSKCLSSQQSQDNGMNYFHGFLHPQFLYSYIIWWCVALWTPLTWVQHDQNLKITFSFSYFWILYIPTAFIYFNQMHEILLIKLTIFMHLNCIYNLSVS